MELLHHPVLRSGLAALLILAGTWAGIRSAAFLTRAYRCPGDPAAPFWVLRGVRAAVLTVAAGATAGGLVYDVSWPLIFSALFLAEELYEAGVLTRILRAGGRGAALP